MVPIEFLSKPKGFKILKSEQNLSLGPWYISQRTVQPYVYLIYFDKNSLLKNDEMQHRLINLNAVPISLKIISAISRS